MVESTTGYKTVPSAVFKATNDWLIDHIVLLLRSADMNSKTGNKLAKSMMDILGKVQKLGGSLEEGESQDLLFEMYHYLSYFRDSARETFHGSVVAAVLDNNMHYKNFLACGEQILKLVG
jgi:hypothetical protein